MPCANLAPSLGQWIVIVLNGAFFTQKENDPRRIGEGRKRPELDPETVARSVSSRQLLFRSVGSGQSFSFHLVTPDSLHFLITPRKFPLFAPSMLRHLFDFALARIFFESSS